MRDDEQQPPPPPRKKMSDREVYNVVTDTVTGVNVRWKDNLFQAVFILVSILVCAGVGALLFTDNRLAGAGLGTFGGLVIGFFVSGIILMIYRMVQHGRSKHE